MSADSIEQSLQRWIDRHDRFERTAREAFKSVKGTGQVTAEMLIASQSTNVVARVVGLTESFIDLTNADRIYGAPSVIRSLHETCCVPCYVAREIVPRLRKGKGTNAVHRLLFRLGFGTGPDAGFGHVRPIRSVVVS